MAQAPPCPYCEASSYRLRDDRWLVCTECGQEFDLQHDLCRSCGRLNQADAQVCSHCQAKLDGGVVNQLIAERSMDERAWRAHRRAISVEQKVEEEEASQRRLDAYWAEDRARREALARVRAERREKEKKVLIAVGIAVIVIIVTLIVVTLILSLTGQPEPTSAIRGVVPQGVQLALSAIGRTRQIGPG